MDVLSANGLSTCFTPKANFKGIFNFDSYINKCYQYSYISVDEEKTEVATVGVISDTEMSAMMDNSPKIFNMDHPFAFLIVSKLNNSILFLGKINILDK